jgi:hypothetical protein
VPGAGLELELAQVQPQPGVRHRLAALVGERQMRREDRPGAVEVAAPQLAQPGHHHG